MSERKVLNKYYPPEFDPSKIPKLRVKKTGVFSIRIMAPFNMRCNTCGEYIYKGKKFNSRKENVDDEDYLGLRIFRFYIRCPRCIAEIAFKTDLARTDYALEAGATRLFEAERLAHEMAEKERKEKEEDELNPMKLLENRTKASRNEMDQIDQLEELKEMNSRHARVDHETLLKTHMVYEEQLLKLQEEEEDNLVKAIMGKANSGPVFKRLHDDDDGDEKELSASAAKMSKNDLAGPSNPSDILLDNSTPPPKNDTTKSAANVPSWQRSIGSFSKKTSLAGLVKKKTTTVTPGASTSTAVSSSSTPTGSSASSLSSSSSSTSSTASTIKTSVCTDSYSSSEGGQSYCNTNVITTSQNGVVSADSVKKEEVKQVTGLGLLGDYSDSDDGSSDE